MVKAGSRASLLARAQFQEIAQQLSFPIEPVWVKTVGDKDLVTSLRSQLNTDFFTRELDEMVLNGTIRIAIHSAKDLPIPLREGLTLVALTPSIDPRDALVMRDGDTFYQLAPGSKIATSSFRREAILKELRCDLTFIDLRGDIQQRLDLLTRKEADGVVVAEAALIRLQLTHLNRIWLPKETAPLQGRLAVVARTGDQEMRDCFAALFRD